MTSDVTKLRVHRPPRRRQPRGGAAQHRRPGHARAGADGAVRAVVPAAPRAGLHRCRRGRSWPAGSSALIRPLGIPAEGGQDSFYYALIDLLEVAEAQRGAELRPSSQGERATGGRCHASGLRARASSCCPGCCSAPPAGRCGCPWPHSTPNSCEPSGRRSSRCSRPPDVRGPHRSVSATPAGWCARPMTTPAPPADETSSMKNRVLDLARFEGEELLGERQGQAQHEQPGHRRDQPDLPRHERPGHGGRARRGRR